MKKIRVLLIEDDAGARALTEALLQPLADFTVCGAAADGYEGLELLRREKPDVILLDLMMPGMDGFGFLRALGREPPPRPPVVVATQIASPHLLSHAVSMGAQFCLVKPLNFEEVPGLLRGVCVNSLQTRAAALLEEMGGTGIGVKAASSAAAALAMDPWRDMLLKQAYAPFMREKQASYGQVEKNIRDMVLRLHGIQHAKYRALLGEIKKKPPDNSTFLHLLAEKLHEN